MDTTHFYRDLLVTEEFEKALDSSTHRELPNDWWVVVTDVIGSTKAVETRRYKDVNSVGVATIVAIVNVDRSIELPFVFGGDGCVCAIPPSLVPGVRKAVLGCKQIAIDGFKLDLRCGLVPVAELRERGAWLRVGKSRLSRTVTQAALSGRGWEHAEKLVKDPETRARYEVVAKDGEEAEADLSGYECRWQGVPPTKECTLAVLVQALDGDGDRRVETYRQVLAHVGSVFNTEDSHPLSSGGMALSFDPRKAWAEAQIRAHGKGLVAQMSHAFFTYLAVIVGTILMKFGVRASTVDWGRYKDEVIENTDHRKFDGALKFVVDASGKEAADLEAFLAREHAQGRLVYGLHRSRAALITCMVASYQGAHVHFVDGSDGGYAIAAKMLKQQLAARIPKKAAS